MQIVSQGDNLHEMSKCIFWKKKTTRMSSAETKRYYIQDTINRGNCLWYGSWENKLIPRPLVVF